MASKTPHVNIHDALQLNGDPETIIEYYRKWSHSYDEDVIENYYGINYICDLLDKHLREQTDFTKPALKIIADIGCGTGLLGKPLHALGYTQLDGIDLSPEMIDKAKQTGYYRSFYTGINVNEAAPQELQGVYDATICIGTFTPGHVEPEALSQLVSMTRKHGLVVLSTRIPYYKTTNFQQVSDDLVAKGSVRLVERYIDAPYRDDGDAHYWVYEVLGG